MADRVQTLARSYCTLKRFKRLDDFLLFRMRVIIDHDETPVPKRLEFFTVDIEHTGILDKTIAVQLFFAFKIVLVDPDFPVADADSACARLVTSPVTAETLIPFCAKCSISSGNVFS